MNPVLGRLPPAMRGASLSLTTIALLCLAAACAVSLAFDRSLPVIGAAFWDGAFGSPYAVGASLNRSCTLAMVGVGFCWAYRARIVNVGAEGQILMGGLAAAALALNGQVQATTGTWGFVLASLAGAAGGMLWGALAGFFKVRFGTNEVISTLLLSFVAIWIVYEATHSLHWLRQPMTSSTALPESNEIPPAMRIPLLLSNASPLHAGIVIAIGVAIAVWLLLQKTLVGLKLVAVGHNARAASHFGIRSSWYLGSGLAVAGAFSGMAGAFMVLGEQYNLKSEFSSGYGFDGLVVGLLSRGSPLAVLGYAAFFGFLRSGGIALEITAGIPSSTILMIQGLLIIAVAGTVLLTSSRN